jgi:Tfp pilus assembly protein PilE
MQVFCSSCGASNEVAAGTSSPCSRCGQAVKALGGPTVQAALPTSKLAIASLVFSMLICLPGVHLLVAGGLAIAALVRIRREQGRLGGQTLAIVALVISGLAVPAYGVLAAIAIPNFVKYQARSKMAEARSEVLALSHAERAYYADQDQYLALGPVPEQAPEEPVAVAPTEEMKKLNWTPDGKLRFSYQVTVSGKGPLARAVITADALFRDPDTDQLAHLELALDASGPGAIQAGRHLPKGAE